MSRRSKLLVLLPVALLLVRSFVPVTNGQIVQPEWAQKSNSINVYRPQPVALSTASRALPYNNPSTQYWQGVADSISSNSGRDLVEIPSALLKNVVSLHPQQLPPNMYLLLKDPKHPSGKSILAADTLEAINSNLLEQHPKRRQDQQRETETLTPPGSGPPVDYFSDDDTSNQLVQTAGSNLDDYSQPLSSKANAKPRQDVPTQDLSRYLIFSNLKRARDGYICHFKLCQVGVSGKRLSNL